MGLGNSKQWEFKKGYLYTIKYQRVTFDYVYTASVLYDRKQPDGSHYFKTVDLGPGDNKNIKEMNNGQPIKQNHHLYNYYFGPHPDISNLHFDAYIEEKSSDLVLWDSWITNVKEGWVEVYNNKDNHTKRSGLPTRFYTEGGEEYYRPTKALKF